MTQVETRPAGAVQTPPGQTPSAPARPRVLLGVLLTAQFMALLDVAVVNVATPTISADLHAGGSALQLVVSGYTIAYAVLLITSARLGERWGFSRLFQAGVVLFTLSSLACGLAPTAGALIAFRFAQGVGSALMVPQVMSLLQRTFTGESRTRALGLYTAVLSSGMVVGQVLGGALVSADLFGLGWRPVFLINVPIGVVLLAAGSRYLPRVRGVARPIDLAGLVLLTAAVALAVVPLVLGHENGWPLWTALSGAASVLALIAFVVTERAITARGGHPLMHGRVVRTPGLLLGAATLLLVMAGVGGFMLPLGLHLQEALGYSPVQVGLMFGPMAAGFGVAGLTWRRIPARFHRFLAVPALVLAAAGYGVLAASLRDGGRVDPALLVMLLVMGLLSGVAYGQVFSSALSRVAVTDAPDASGIVTTVIQLGQVIGVAVIGTLYFAHLRAPFTPVTSGHAVAWSCGAVGAVSLAAALVASLRPRVGQA